MVSSTNQVSPLRHRINVLRVGLVLMHPPCDIYPVSVLISSRFQMKAHLPDGKKLLNAPCRVYAVRLLI